MTRRTNEPPIPAEDRQDMEVDAPGQPPKVLAQWQHGETGRICDLPPGRSPGAGWRHINNSTLQDQQPPKAPDVLEFLGLLNNVPWRVEREVLIWCRGASGEHRCDLRELFDALARALEAARVEHAKTATEGKLLIDQWVSRYDAIWQLKNQYKQCAEVLQGKQWKSENVPDDVEADIELITRVDMALRTAIAKVHLWSNGTVVRLVQLAKKALPPDQ